MLKSTIYTIYKDELKMINKTRDREEIIKGKHL